MSGGRTSIGHPVWLPCAAGVTAFVVAFATFCSFDPAWTLRGDNLAVMFPMNLAAYRQWIAGQAPEWSSGFWWGFPLLADPTSLALYWPNLLAFAMTESPHLRAYDLSTALHAAVLVSGTVSLLGLLGVRRSVSLFGGALIFLAPMHVWYSSAMITGYAPVCWWPWVLVAAERLCRPLPLLRSLALGWLALASCALVYPEFAFYIGLVAVAWVATRRAGVSFPQRLVRLALFGVGALALAAPQLLPTLLFLPETTRAAVPDDAFVAAQVRPELAQFLYPSLAESIPSMVGVATLILAVLGATGSGQRRLFLSVLAVLSLLTALGDTGPTYEFLHALPVFELFRQPMKFKLLTELSIALLASLGLERMIVMAGDRLSRNLVVVLALLACVENFTYAALRISTNTELPGANRGGWTERYAKLDGGIGTRLAYMSKLGTGRLIESVDLRGVPMVDGIRLAGGGPNSLLSEHNRSLSMALALWRTNGEKLAFMGVALFLEPAPDEAIRRPRYCLNLAEGRQLLLAGRGPFNCLYRAHTADPVVVPANDVVPASDVATVVKQIELALRDEWEIVTTKPEPNQCMEVEEPNATVAHVERFDHRLPESIPIVAPPGVVTARSGASARVTMGSYADGRMDFSVVSDRPAFALVRETYSAGWQVRINGDPVPVYPAAGVFFAVPVPAGKSQVELEYRLPGFREGVRIAAAWVGVVSVVGLLWLLANRFRARQSER